AAAGQAADAIGRQNALDRDALLQDLNGRAGNREERRKAEALDRMRLNWNAYHGSESERRQALKELKGSKADQDWCKTHIPLPPTPSIYETAADAARKKTYEKRKRQ